MRWLAIDTSAGTTVGVVETSDDGGAPVVRAGRSNEDARGHVEALAPMIEACLREAGPDGGALAPADLDAIAVGTGPAPFTGLRVGFASAAAFARGAGLAVHGVGSLDAIAWAAPGRPVVVTDARRREVYWAAYSGGADPGADGWRVEGPAVGPPSDVLAWCAEHGGDVVGAGVALYPDLGDAGAGTARVTPAGLVAVAAARLATGVPTPLTPQYLRRPDVHAGGGRKRAS